MLNTSTQLSPLLGNIFNTALYTFTPFSFLFHFLSCPILCLSLTPFSFPFHFLSCPALRFSFTSFSFLFTSYPVQLCVFNTLFLSFSLPILSYSVSLFHSLFLSYSLPMSCPAPCSSFPPLFLSFSHPVLLCVFLSIFFSFCASIRLFSLSFLVFFSRFFLPHLPLPTIPGFQLISVLLINLTNQLRQSESIPLKIHRSFESNAF